MIHSDFERGFIRAEVIHWDELLELGSWNKAKDVGKLRVEGKDYVVAGRRRPGDPLQRLRRPRSPRLVASRDGLVAPGRGGAGVAGGGRRRGRPGARGCSGGTAIDGALLLVPARSVHTIGMRFPIDVAWLDGDLTVLRTARLARNRMSRPVLRAHAVLEAEAGAFARWSLAVGDQLERKD